MECRMTSPIDIANMGLGLIGEARIEDFAEGTALANLATTFYAPARLALLGMTDWDFATGWCQLTQLTETPISEWDYQYTFPAKPPVVAMWELSDPDALWTRAYDPVVQQTVVYTDYTATTVGARCTFDVENTALWNPLLVQALAYKMALDITLAKTGNVMKAGAMRRGMEFWLGQAGSKSAMQRAHEITPASTLTRIRG